MKEREAVKILAGTINGSKDEARQWLAAAICLESEIGDPDDSLMDWVAAGDYTGNETVKTLTKEWDERD